MIVWSMPYDLSLEWQTIESEHFLVIFPGKSPTLQHFEYQEFALTIADIAEETYQKLIPYFGEPYNKNRKTAIILEDFSDSVYGFATVLPHPAIRINLTAPGFKTFDTKFKSWLKILIAHEYTHIAHFDMTSKATSFLRLFLGQIIAPNALQPMWAIEGLAIFYESKLGSGGRLTDNRYDMYLRSDFLEENPIDLKLLKDTYFTSWPGGNIPYIYGQSLVHYIAQEYGEEKLLDISEYFCANPLLGINWSIKKALGINQNDLYKNWEDKKLSQYQEQLENVYSFSEITHSEQITNHQYWADNPIWWQKDNKDKAILLYRVNIPELYPTIRSYNQLNKEESIIINRTTGHGTSYSLSPDNKYLIYSKLQIFKEFYQYYDLFLFNLQNGNQIQLSEGMRIKDPGWHPSKSEYNVVAVINIAGSSNLVLFSLENTFPSLFGGNNKNTDFTSSKNEMLTFEDLLYLTSFNDGTQISQPVWSPDGKKIAFSMWQNGYQDIYILELGTANEIKYLNPIIRDKHIDISPSWSADGEYIYFTSDRSGIFNLYAYQLKEKILFRLTNVTTGAFEPAGSPDGKEIAFIQYHSTGYELHLAETKNLLWKPVSFETQTNTGDGSLYQVNISHKPIQGTVLCIRNKNKEQSPVSYSPWDSLFPTYWIPYFNLTSKDLYLGFSSTAQDYLGYYYLPFKLAKGVFTPSLYYDFHFIQYSQNPNLSISWQGETLLEDGHLQNFFDAKSTNAVFQANLNFHNEGYTSQQDSARYFSGNFTLGFQSRLYNFKNDGNNSDNLSFRKINSLILSYDYNDTEKYQTSVGPEIGSSFSLNYQHANTLLGSDLTFNKLLFDGRKYFPLSESNQSIALRFVAGFATKGLTQKEKFYLGGNSNSTELSSINNSFPLRGFPASTFSGNNVLSASIEYRFPIKTVERKIGFDWASIFLERISGSLFFDAGQAWEGKLLQLPSELNAAIGAEINFKFKQAQSNPFIITIGASNPISESAKVRLYFQTGISF